MMYKSFLVLSLMLLVACGGGKPAGVIPEEKMNVILWDAAMAGEYASGYLYNQNPTQNRIAVNNALMKEIFKLHDITQKEFDKSVEYYKKKPKLLMAILDSVTAKHGAPTAQPVPQPNAVPAQVAPLAAPVGTVNK